MKRFRLHLHSLLQKQSPLIFTKHTQNAHFLKLTHLHLHIVHGRQQTVIASAVAIVIVIAIVPIVSLAACHSVPSSTCSCSLSSFLVAGYSRSLGGASLVLQARGVG